MVTSLDQILEKCNTLKISELRKTTDTYKELVFYTKDTEEWDIILSRFLGPAQKPEGAKPTAEDLEIAKNYGGVHINQTLYRQDYDDTIVLVMFWPWQDGAHTTIKMVSLEKAE